MIISETTRYRVSVLLGQYLPMYVLVVHVVSEEPFAPFPPKIPLIVKADLLRSSSREAVGASVHECREFAGRFGAPSWYLHFVTPPPLLSLK